MSKVTEYRYPNAIVRIHEDKPIDMDKLKRGVPPICQCSGV